MSAADRVPVGVWLAAAALAAVGFYVWRSGGVRQAAAGAVQAAGQAAAGAVEGVGLAVGVPLTSADQCGQDLAAGRWWQASFSCPAGRYVSAVAGGRERPVDNSVMDPRDAMAQRGTGAGTAPPVERSPLDDYLERWGMWGMSP